MGLRLGFGLKGLGFMVGGVNVWGLRPQDWDLRGNVPLNPKP